MPHCALTTTMAVSGPQIKEAYDLALSLGGSEFATGDCKYRVTKSARILQNRKQLTLTQQAVEISCPASLVS